MRCFPARALPAVLLVSFVLPAVLAGGATQAATTRAAPSNPADSTPRFEDLAQVVSVEVPVTVVGRDGQPVRGLTRDDFELFDDGEAQPIRDLRVIDLAVARPEPLALAERDAQRSAERRHFLFLFDLSFSSPTSILKARLAARDFVLRSLHPSDLAAVATVSLEQGVRLVVTFTPDRSQLARGIDTLGLRGPGDTTALSVDPLRFLLSQSSTDITGGGSSGGGSGPGSDRESLVLDYLAVIGQQIDRSQKLFDRARINAWTRTLGDLARNLDAVKGRKQVVLFSEGFDSRLLLGRETGTREEEFDQLDVAFGQIWQVDTDNRYGNTELQSAMARMIEEFRRADCAIQAVDIGGLRARADATGADRRSGKEALFVMANETGGALFEDANDLEKQLGRVLERSAVTYVLTFERSDLVADAAYHRLQVKAKLPPGARLTHRSGYYAPQPFRDLDPLEKTLLASDQIASATPRRDIELDVLTASFRASEASAYVPVIVEIDGASLLRGATATRVPLEIYAYVSDQAGQMRDFFSQVVGLELGKNRGAVEKTGVKYYGHFDLGPGRYLLRILVRNAETGLTGVETVSLEVPAFADDRFQLLPPFFLEPPGRWLLVREKADEAESGRSVVYPFVVNGEPFVPAARPAVRRDRAARLCLVAYNLGRDAPRLSARVTAADGRTVNSSARLLLEERTVTGLRGVDKLLAHFDAGELAAGDYTLEVALVDSASGVERSSRIPFAVQD